MTINNIRIIISKDGEPHERICAPRKNKRRRRTKKRIIGDEVFITEHVDHKIFQHNNIIKMKENNMEKKIFII